MIVETRRRRRCGGISAQYLYPWIVPQENASQACRRHAWNLSEIKNGNFLKKRASYLSSSMKKIVLFTFYIRFESNRVKGFLSMKKFVAIAAAALVSAVVVAAPSTKTKVETTAATASAPATASGVLAPAAASAASN